MNQPRATAGADLAADLIADLNRLPTQPDLAVAQTQVRVADDRPAARGPAAQVVVRVTPLAWHRPSLRVNWNCVSMRVGAMYMEASTRWF
jgi:hypothetical protein